MTSSDWWSKKLNEPGQVQPQAPRYQPQVQQPMYQQPQPVQPPAYLPESATSAARCPACRSGNYAGATPEARPRCYDCGYPITQTGTGLPGISTPSSGPTQAAKQIATGGWNPTTIVDRIG